LSADGPPPADHLVLERRTARGWLVAGGVAVGIIVLQSLALAIAWPRAMAYDALVAEHAVVQERLLRIDQQLAEVDRILLRMRLYDAQLRSLGEPTGDAGPLPPDVYANASGEEGEGEEGLGRTAEFGVPFARAGVRSQSEWAEGVEARVESLLRTFASTEPGLHRFVGELEQLAALENALPSAWPARGEFTSGFGWRRNPLGQRWRFHSGIDVAGDRGDPVYAAAQGKVVTAGWSSGYGRYVVIDHGFGITTLYGHCHQLLVREGEHVRRGDTIARMGNTGMSTGDHLHFEVHVDGAAVDPLDYLRRGRSRKLRQR
jgi:murein DD-endopeptidase MepM/ murein hydrolase activator NlpD